MEKKPNLSSEKYQIPINYEGDYLRRPGEGDEEYKNRVQEQSMEDGRTEEKAKEVAEKTLMMEEELSERTSGARGRREQIAATRKAMEAALAENDAAFEAGTLTQMEHDQKAKEIQENADRKVDLLERAGQRQKEKYVADTYANADSSEFYDEANTIASAEDAEAYDRWMAKQDAESEKLNWAAEQNAESPSKEKLDRIEAAATRHAERIARTKTPDEIAASEEAILNNLERHYQQKHDINVNNIAQPVSTEEGRHLTSKDFDREVERVKERASRQREQIEQYFANQETKKAETSGERSEAEMRADMLAEAAEEMKAREGEKRSEAEMRADMLAEAGAERRARETSENESGKAAGETPATEGKAEEKEAPKPKNFLTKLNVLRLGIERFGAKDESEETKKQNAADLAFIEAQRSRETSKATSTMDVYTAADWGFLGRVKTALSAMATACNKEAAKLIEASRFYMTDEEKKAQEEERNNIKIIQKHCREELATIEEAEKRKKAKEIVDGTMGAQGGEAKAQAEAKENTPRFKELFTRMEELGDLLESAYNDPMTPPEQLRQMRDLAMKARTDYANEFARLGNNPVEGRILEISNAIDQGIML